jgi:hypothetical protein
MQKFEELEIREQRKRDTEREGKNKVLPIFFDFPSFLSCCCV